MVEVHSNGVTVKPVDKPRDATIRVNLDCVTLCPDESQTLFGWVNVFHENKLKVLQECIEALWLLIIYLCVSISNFVIILYFYHYYYYYY